MRGNNYIINYNFFLSIFFKITKHLLTQEAGGGELAYHLEDCWYKLAGARCYYQDVRYNKVFFQGEPLVNG